MYILIQFMSYVYKQHNYDYVDSIATTWGHYGPTHCLLVRTFFVTILLSLGVSCRVCCPELGGCPLFRCCYCTASIETSVSAYSSVRYWVEVRYWECPLIESTVYVCMHVCLYVSRLRLGIQFTRRAQTADFLSCISRARGRQNSSMDNEDDEEGSRAKASCYTSHTWASSHQ